MKVAAALLAVLAIAGAAAAQTRANVAGRFDYYVLALSWSPAFCADPAAARRETLQCGAPRGFIVHGLWPQHERGYPRDCPSPMPKTAPAALVNRQMDIMPSPGLVQQQWRAHGLCSGLSQQAYFDLTRRLRARVNIPQDLAPRSAAVLTAAQIRAAFVRANPGLPGAAMAVICDRDRLEEARVCFTKTGAFRACGKGVADRCGRNAVRLAR